MSSTDVARSPARGFACLCGVDAPFLHVITAWATSPGGSNRPVRAARGMGGTGSGVGGMGGGGWRGEGLLLDQQSHPVEVPLHTCRHNIGLQAPVSSR